MYVCCHVKYPLLLSDFSETRIFSSFEKSSNINFHENPSSGSWVFFSCRRTYIHEETNCRFSPLIICLSWPPLSPDLKSFDSYLWRSLKDHAYTRNSLSVSLSLSLSHTHPHPHTHTHICIYRRNLNHLWRSCGNF